MAAEIKGIFREDLRELILGSKLLVVGAGGIGCEILKNLVMCGFNDIEIVSKLKFFCNLMTTTNKTFVFRLISIRLM